MLPQATLFPEVAFHFPENTYYKRCVRSCWSLTPISDACGIGGHLNLLRYWIS